VVSPGSVLLGQQREPGVAHARIAP